MGKLHRHKAAKQRDQMLGRVRNYLCTCGHRWKEHSSPSECEKCDCQMIRRVGAAKVPKGIQPRRWVGNRFV